MFQILRDFSRILFKIAHGKIGAEFEQYSYPKFCSGTLTKRMFVCFSDGAQILRIKRHLVPASGVRSIKSGAITRPAST